MISSDILSLISELYSEYRPLYLARLGSELKKHGVEYKKISDFVESNLSNDYIIVQNPSVKEKVALARKEEKDDIFNMICENVAENMDGIQFITRFPRAFLLAFCKDNCDSDESLYVSLEAPIRFYRSQNDEGTLEEVEGRYRVAVHVPYKISKIEHGDANILMETIKQWGEEKHINLDTIIEYSRKRTTGISLLYRILPHEVVEFIEAQPENIRNNIVIPLKMITKD